MQRRKQSDEQELNQIEWNLQVGLCRDNGFSHLRNLNLLLREYGKFLV
jgi:hypothetical protein